MGKNKEVAKFEVCLDQYGALVIGAVHWLAIRNQHIMQNKYFVSQGDPDAHVVCIVELRGKLAVRRTWTFWSRDIVAPFWVVFELVGLDTDESTPQQLFKWVEVTSLGDHVLFLGPTCSKAIQLSTGEHGGPRRNRIYYCHPRCYIHKDRIPDDAKEFLTSSNKDDSRVYYKEDESVDNDVVGITSVGHYVCGGGHPPIWLFPQDP
jgi:hypothetical protein